MVDPTRFGITLSSSGSAPSAVWEMLNWGAVDRILWMGVLCLVTWCVAISGRHASRHYYSQNKVLITSIFPEYILPVFFTLFPTRNPRTHVIKSKISSNFQSGFVHWRSQVWKTKSLTPWLQRRGTLCLILQSVSQKGQLSLLLSISSL
jgi:hypothetical protein